MKFKKKTKKESNKWKENKKKHTVCVTISNSPRKEKKRKKIQCQVDSEQQKKRKKVSYIAASKQRAQQSKAKKKRIWYTEVEEESKSNKKTDSKSSTTNHDKSTRLPSSSISSTVLTSSFVSLAISNASPASFDLNSFSTLISPLSSIAVCIPSIRSLHPARLVTIQSPLSLSFPLRSFFIAVSVDSSTLSTTLEILSICVDSCGTAWSDLMLSSSDWMLSTMSLVWFSRKSYTEAVNVSRHSLRSEDQ
ncbi:hypothetical protein FN846DRAFT_130289 [Sphaerosporella brunnea]|uniref:Uncharacterized protein n=1 Tax=Sphaerosporella brunnea TaxID=1250544 RepID=A0A5J5F8W9_9PEZI|nr:hypothetical protein FN846DRAFT_130289 [Sphaerosporella brunnea]